MASKTTSPSRIKNAVYKITPRHIYFSFPKSILKKLAGENPPDQPKISWAIVNGRLQIFGENPVSGVDFPVLFLDEEAFESNE